MDQFEDALQAIEARLATTRKSADALLNAVKRLQKAAQTGNVGELERGVSALAERGNDAAEAARDLATTWTFDSRSYLAEGYPEELRAAAAAAGISFTERDGRLYAFPLLLKIEPKDMAVRVGKKLERRIRPKQLVALLSAMQRRPQRFSEARFLDLIYKTYERIVRPEWRKTEKGLGPVVPLADVHAVLTLLPGSEYPIEEFGRDLLLLDRKPELRTREGHQFRFPGSALARERQPVKVYDEEGRERMYFGLAFVKEP